MSESGVCRGSLTSTSRASTHPLMKMARKKAARRVHSTRQNHQLLVRFVSLWGGSSKAASSCWLRFSSGDCDDASNGVSSVYGGGERGADDRLGDRGGVLDEGDAGRADMASACYSNNNSVMEPG